MQSKLLGLNTQLLGQERLVQALKQQKQAEIETEAPSKLLQAGVSAGLISPAKFEQLLMGQKGAAAQGVPTAEQTIAESIAMPSGKLPEVQSGALKPSTAPIVEQLTEADSITLSPKEYEQKQSRILRQQRDVELFNQQARFEQEQAQTKKKTFREAGKELADTEGAKEYERVGVLLGTAENIGKKEKPSIGDIQKLIAMAAKTVDKSQVTMGEQDLYTRVDPLITRWETQIKSKLFGDPQISKKAINDTIGFIRNIYGIMGENYNRQAAKIAQSYEVPEVDSIMRLPKYANPEAQKLERLRQLQDELAQLKAARGVK
jgi:hypothetical protein